MNRSNFHGIVENIILKNKIEIKPDKEDRLQEELIEAEKDIEKGINDFVKEIVANKVDRIKSYCDVDLKNYRDEITKECLESLLK